VPILLSSLPLSAFLIYQIRADERFPQNRKYYSGQVHTGKINPDLPEKF
jgi:hypothetical protein